MDRNDKEPPAKKRRKKRQPCGKCCSVWGCSNSRKKDGLGVFGFPKPDQEPERHAEWVRVVSHTRANFKYHPTSSFICADHFPVESISNLTKIRLLSASNPHDNTPWKLVPDAVPIISKLPPRPRPGSTHTTKPTRRRPAAVKRERRRLVDAALQAEAEKMAPPAPAELDDLGEPSNNPDHPNYIFLKVEDNLEGNLESNHKELVSESTMSNKKHSETVDGLVIKEESDNIFVADNDMMEKVKEEREDEMVVWKIEDDVTFKEESLDMDMEDDSYPYEDCEDPLLTLKCKSCEKVCATRSDLETHTENMHGSGKHPRGQKRKKLVKSKRDRLHDHGKSSCDKDTSQTVNTEDQIATEDQADTSINEIAQEDHGQSFQTPRNPPKRARKSEDSPVNEAVNCLKSLTHIVSGKDENSAFGDFVADKMKTCKRPRVEISLAQRYINDILFRLDMGLLSADIQSMYKSHTYPTSIPSHSPLPHSPHFSGHSSPIQPCSPVPTVSASPVPPQQTHFSGHSSPIQPCSPVPTVSASPVPPQQSHFSGHSSPIQPCSPVPTVSASPVPPQQSQSLAGTLNNPFDFLEL